MEYRTLHTLFQIACALIISWYAFYGGDPWRYLLAFSSWFVAGVVIGCVWAPSRS